MQRAVSRSRRGVPTNAEFRGWVAVALGRRRAGEVVVRVVDERESAQLNLTYRRKRGPTNVLSFPAGDDVAAVAPWLGDLVICAPLVAREARAQRKTARAHWAHLTIHGTLHLLGYDHVRSEDAETMEALEVKLMRRLGFNNPYEDESKREDK